MSHELRTPLNAIIGYGELILDDWHGADPADLARIVAAGRHLLALVNDVLDMAKIESGRLEVACQPFDLTRLLAQIRDDSESLARRRSNTMRWEVAPDVPQVWTGDELRLRQVLLNLIGNATKFTADGLVAATVRRDEEGLRFDIRDTGPGIEPEVLERVFEPFVQGSHRGARSEGSGLGLAISRRLVEAMGGTLTVRTEVGVGSTFTVRLPVTAA
jgi:signal transduction histidine kinase